jgi:hypothetical protein
MRIAGSARSKCRTQQMLEAADAARRCLRGPLLVTAQAADRD